MTKDKKPEDKDNWSTGAKVGAAAVGSAALVAALLYANKKRKDKKVEPAPTKRKKSD
ncbi:MAG: hypothetical protein V3V15_08425 [Sphingorhabdus sp.]